MLVTSTDGGTPIEVVAVLMGHMNLVTTGIYYRVNEERKRKAVDLLAALQVGRDGNQTRPRSSGSWRARHCVTRSVK